MGWFGKDKVTVANTGTATAVGAGSYANSGIDYGYTGLPVSLEKKRDAARNSLSKLPVALKMAVRVYVDGSGSMWEFFQNGTVQEVTERGTGYALAMDDDGEVPVGSFANNHVSHGVMTAQNYQGFVNANIRCGGGTNLSASLEDLEKAAKKAKEPIYALIVTDGAPNDRRDVKARLDRLSKLPVFVKILVVGNDQSAWNYVVSLDDDDTNRGIDNVDGQKVPNPAKLSDQEFADLMTEELYDWYRAAQDADIIK